jgi:hypothetical protein
MPVVRRTLWSPGLPRTLPCETPMPVGGDLRQGASPQRQCTEPDIQNPPHRDRDLRRPDAEVIGRGDGEERES